MHELGFAQVGSRVAVPGAVGPMVGVRLLGSFEVRVGDRVVDLPAAGQRLVALLALHGRRTRSRVAGSLWPSSSEPRALGSLRTAMWRVNGMAPGLVRGDARDVDLDPATDVDVTRTLAVLRAALDSDRPVGDLPTRPPDRGGLLPDWEDAWLDVEREQLRQLWLHALEAQASRLLAAGAFGQALDLALASVHADPLRESAHRMVIRVHLAEGNQADAWTAYRTCARIMVQTLGVSPSPQTTALLHDLFPPGRRRPAAWTSAASALQVAQDPLAGEPAR